MGGHCKLGYLTLAQSPFSVVFFLQIVLDVICFFILQLIVYKSKQRWKAQ
jgi:hypothetical protein